MTLDLARLHELRGWTSAAMTRLGVTIDGDRIVIPVHDATGDLVGRLRYQPDPARLNGLRKMLADAGTTRELFPPPESIADDEHGGTVWLVEGEPDALRVWSIGLTAVGVPGAQNWRDEWGARFTGRRWTVVVCFDCDAPGRENTSRAASALAASGVDVRVVDLDPDRDDGYDLSDFLAAATDTDMREQAARLLGAIAQAAPPFEPTPSPEVSEESGVEFVTGAEFVAHPVPQAEPIVVDVTAATAIPANGFLMTYGDGGAGKTTLDLDGVMHFCAGIPWLEGLLTPTRALRVGWVENEGPQEEFRLKLERKLNAWRDRFPADRFHVLSHPWGRLDLRRGEHREGLAAAVREHELDLLVIGPLNDLGMEGGGTPDQVRDFHDYIRDVQQQAGRLVTVWVLHHENTAGRISGAWTGRPDLLVHVVAQGHGKTRVHWQKAKWSSALHGTTNHLQWVDGEGFALAPDEAPRPERTWDEIAEYVLAHGGAIWGDVRKAIPGEDTYLGRRRDAMLDDGLLINTGTGRNFKLWHRDDPSRPSLDLGRAHDRTTAERPACDTGDEG